MTRATYTVQSNNPSRGFGEEVDPPIRATSTFKPNPLPKLQIAVIYAIRLTFTIARAQSLPYYNAFLAKIAASAGADTGYYSGLVVMQRWRSSKMRHY